MSVCYLGISNINGALKSHVNLTFQFLGLFKFQPQCTLQAEKLRIQKTNVEDITWWQEDINSSRFPIRCFHRTPTNYIVKNNLRDKLYSSEIIDILTSEDMENTPFETRM